MFTPWKTGNGKTYGPMLLWMSIGWMISCDICYDPSVSRDIESKIWCVWYHLLLKLYIHIPDIYFANNKILVNYQYTKSLEVSHYYYWKYTVFIHKIYIHNMYIHNYIWYIFTNRARWYYAPDLHTVIIHIHMTTGFVSLI